jgi:hypothetical protein
MSLVKGKFVDKTIPIQSDNDPVDAKDLARKGYVDSQAASAADAKVEDQIVNGVTAKAPSQNAVFDALALKQASLGTGTTAQFLRGDLAWAAIPKAAKVFTVGVDANSIAGCIALCTSPTATNNYIVEIPPGTYTENLTIPGNVHLKGLANPSDSICVKIVGQHTITGASLNGLNNRVSIANILFTSTHATTATFEISGTLADTEVQMSGCYVENSATASTAKNISLGAFGKLYANNVKSRMASSGNGGAHFTIATGGQLYTQYGLDVSGGSCAIDMTGQGYAQIVYGILSCQGASTIKIAANGQVLMQGSSVTNNAAIGNGINLLGANANCFATHCVFNVLDNAASFVVTGVAGSFFGMFANSYSHIAGLVVRNTKIGTNVTQLRYSGSLAASDISDFQSSARTAAVGDAIADGVTTVAPSQNAVFDALALKLSTSLKGANNGLAELDASGKVPVSQIPASVGAVQSVNTKTGTVVLQTDDIAEAAVPTNKWFTDARAKSAAVGDAIADGVTDKAPSQNAVYDALALKLDQASKGAAGGVAELDGSGKVPTGQLPALAITETYVVASEVAMLALAAQKGDVAIRTDLSKSFILAGTDPTVLADWKELLTPTDAVLSVNGQTGSVSLDSDDVAEGATNKYFSDAAAQAAAVVDSTAGSETDQAASVSAMKLYVAGEISAIPAPAIPQGKKERKVLSSTDITNGYIDCAFEAMADTMMVMTGGVVHNEGSGDDYVLSLVAGKTRITFEPDLAAILAAGDDIYLQYLRLV